MREILFRAKCKPGYDYPDGDGWVYGGIITDGEQYGIVTVDNVDSDDFGYIPVKTDTICQFTGLLDKNGKKLFEGDIFENSAGGRYPVFFENGCFMSQLICDKPNSYMTKLKLCDIHHLITDECEVIGNKWDNQELLNNKNTKQ
ncbi:MAG: YopX family protein [Bacteroidales bacterium]